MSEKKIENNQGTNVGSEPQVQAQIQPVAQATVAPQAPEKLGFFAKIKKAIVDNKKVIVAALGGAAAGAAGTIAYGYVANKQAQKQQVTYIPEENVNPLDPNV